MSRLMVAAIPAAALLLLTGCEVTTPTVSVPQPVAVATPSPPVVVQSAPTPPTVVQTVPPPLPPPPSTVLVP